MSENSEIITGLWEIIKKKLITNDIPQEIVAVIRIAFYTGFGSALQVMQKIFDDGVSEEDGLKLLNEIEDEMKAFELFMKLGVL